jgi:isoleucyl-tRNA synthetase
MIKNLIITALSIGCIVLFIFSNLKANELEEKIEAMDTIAGQQEQAAMDAAAEARRQKAEALRQKELADQSLSMAKELEQIINKQTFGKQVLELSREVSKYKLLAAEQERAAIEAAAEARRQEALAIQERAAALEARDMAEQARDMAVTAESEASRQKDLAVAARMEAEKQRDLAMNMQQEMEAEMDKVKQKLEDCQNN